MRFISVIFAAFWAVFLLAGPASADPVTAAWTAIAAAAKASAVVGALIKIAASVALSALAQALMPKPRSGGIQTDTTQEGGTQSQSFIVGRYATAGSRIAPRMTYGRSHKWMFDVIQLSDLPIAGVSRIAINGAYRDMTPGVDHGGLVFDYSGELYAADVFTGSQTTASAKLLAQFGGAGERPWQADMIGRSMAYALMYYYYDSEKHSGWPEALFEVQGIRLYDVRKDSTAGGSGAHRWANPATWEWTENPVVIIYNILRGITLPDGRVWGGECVAEDLPLAVWAAAMNKCDEAVPIAAGGTVARYRCGFEIKVAEDEPADIIEELLKSCSGSIVEIGGVYKVRAGGPGLPVYFFSDDDLLVTSAHEFTPFPGLAETFNTIYATYPEPSSIWESHDAPERTDAAYLAEDQDRILPVNVALPAVPFAGQVQRLMRAWLKDNRRWRRHTVTLGHYGAGVEPLDTVAWSSERNGYTTKHFEVAQVVENAALVQQWELREVDPTDYDWSTDFELPTSVPSVLPDLPVYQSVPGWAVAATTVKDGTGADRRPALRFTWTAADISAQAIRVQVRVSGQTDIQALTIADVDAGGVIYAEGILPATTYQARARLRQNGPTDWTGWTSVTTHDVRVSEDDLADALQTRIDDLEAQADAAVLQADAAMSQAADLRVRLDTAIRGGLKGWLADPVFAKWAGATLEAANWADRSGVASYGSLFPGEFGSGVQIAAPAGSAQVLIVANTATGLLGADPAAAAVVISLGLEYSSGDPTGARFRVEWSADGVTWTRGAMLGASTPFGTFAEHGITPSPGVMQFKEVLVQKPAGTFAHLRLFLQPKISSVAGAQAMTIHAANIRSATEAEAAAGNVAGLSASVTAHGTAISTLQAGAAAGYQIRAQAGGAVSLIDLIAADGSGGVPTSIVKIAASDIFLDGSVGMPQLVVTEFTGNVLPNGAFPHGDLRGWTLVAGTFSIYDQATDGTNPGNTSPTKYGVKIALDAASNRSGRCLDYLPCRAGDRFSTSFQYAVAGTTRDATLRLMLNFFDPTGALISGTHLTETNTASNTWLTKSGTAQAPANTAFARVLVQRDAGGAGIAYVTNVEVVKQRTGRTLITPRGLTTDLVDTDDFHAAGLAVFGGDLQSTNFNAGAGAGWQITQAGTLIVPNSSITNAKIGNLAVDTIKIGNEAVTKFDYAYAAGNLASSGNPTIMQSTVIARARLQPLVIHASLTVAAWSGGSQIFRVQIRDGTNGIVIAYVDYDVATMVGHKIDLYGIDTNITSGAITYQLRVTNLGIGVVTCSQRFIGALNTFK